MSRYIVQHRRGTAEQWASHNTLIPKEGELVIEIDQENSLHKLKIGDGVHTYAELAYLMAGDEVVTQVLAQVLPRTLTVTLEVDAWEEVTSATDSHFGYYGQTIAVDCITEHSRLDLQPNADMIAELQKAGVAFVTANKGGVITVYSVGNMPLKTYTMQATIIETDVVEVDEVVGIPIGTANCTTTDTTLTESGKAADAKAVGDALQSKITSAELNAALADATVNKAGSLATARYIDGHKFDGSSDMNTIYQASVSNGQITINTGGKFNKSANGVIRFYFTSTVSGINSYQKIMIDGSSWGYDLYSPTVGSYPQKIENCNAFFACYVVYEAMLMPSYGNNVLITSHYNLATTSAAGLMSSSDKAKLNSIAFCVGTVITDGTLALDLSGANLTNGAKVTFYVSAVNAGATATSTAVGINGTSNTGMLINNATGESMSGKYLIADRMYEAVFYEDDWFLLSGPITT